MFVLLATRKDIDFSSEIENEMLLLVLKSGGFGKAYTGLSYAINNFAINNFAFTRVYENNYDFFISSVLFTLAKHSDSLLKQLRVYTSTT